LKEEVAVVVLVEHQRIGAASVREEPEEVV
jgi:hypothetical protein